MQDDLVQGALCRVSRSLVKKIRKHTHYPFRCFCRAVDQVPLNRILCKGGRHPLTSTTESTTFDLLCKIRLLRRRAPV